MKRIMNFLMLSCQKATELISKKEVQDLSIVESVQLKMHKSMCNACSAYEKQSKTIDKTLFHINKRKSTDKQSLTEDFKQSLIDKIKKS